jgi:hypothetical protein
MEDPLPENIEGSKRVTHTVEHRINWGYVAVAFVGLVLLVKVGPVLASRSSEESDEEPSL